MARSFRLILSIIFFSAPCIASEAERVKRLEAFSRGQIPKETLQELKHQAAPDTNPEVFSSNQQPLIFKHFPSLAQKLSYISLADLPTPVKQCTTFGNRIGASQLYIKDDGTTGRFAGKKRAFGGNKVRKLEFILAEALAHDAQEVVTFGCSGSNHALATAVYAHQLGIKPIAILFDQPNSATVKRNLLLHLLAKTELNHVIRGAYLKAAELFKSRKEKGSSYPYIIPFGGSMPLGVLGYVNAVFELKKQIETGLLPEPEVIFVAAGTSGTSAGILLGLEMTQLSSKLVAIQISPGSKPDIIKTRISKLFEETSQFLHTCDENIPEYQYPENRCEILQGFTGKAYGEPTKEALQVAQEFITDEGIPLDPTYTSKACAGMVTYIKERGLQDEPLLFWNTYCGEDYAHITEKLDYHELPGEFYRYFEN